MSESADPDAIKSMVLGELWLTGNHCECYDMVNWLVEMVMAFSLPRSVAKGYQSSYT